MVGVKKKEALKFLFKPTVEADMTDITVIPYWKNLYCVLLVARVTGESTSFTDCRFLDRLLLFKNLIHELSRKLVIRCLRGILC